ncbi:MAG: phosphoribosylglycinamide formyltransferase [Bacilli bacterium]|jgi:phosphoribosylglycinamide formyltransferase-1|nr:phosphoribosylglycinamide formyltransferase [Bacilli bacterium]
MLRIGIFASGSGTNFENIVQACENKQIDGEVIVLVCNNKYAKALDRAKKHNIPTIVVDYNDINRVDLEHSLLIELSKYNLDLICLCGFMKQFTPLFVNAYKNLILNVHPSLLPKYKGINAIKKAFDNKEDKTGVTIHFVDEELDNGKIILQQEIDIKGLTLKEVEEKVHQVEYKLYIDAINKVKGTIKYE